MRNEKSDHHMTSFQTKDTENWAPVKIYSPKDKMFKWLAKEEP